MTSLTPMNLLGILAAGFSVMMLGWLWFDLLFGRTYAVVLGRDQLPPSKPAPLYFVGPSICMLVTTMALAVLMRWLAVPTLPQAAGLGVLVGVGLLGSTAVNMGINPNIPRPLSYGFLSASYFLASSILICVLLFSVG